MVYIIFWISKKFSFLVLVFPFHYNVVCVLASTKSSFPLSCMESTYFLTSQLSEHMRMHNEYYLFVIWYAMKIDCFYNWISKQVVNWRVLKGKRLTASMFVYTTRVHFCISKKGRKPPQYWQYVGYILLILDQIM